MELRKFIATTIREYFNEQQMLKENSNRLLKKYQNVKFSPTFFNKEESMIKYQTTLYLEKIHNFINFYTKYKPDGVRVINGIDFYKESKHIFDNIINGEIYIDEVFTNPDNPLRNTVMLLHIDEPKLKSKLNENFAKINIIKENKNFIYNDSDYERYLSLEKNILDEINKILPNDNFFASTWYRRSHENDKDLIFSEMHFPSKSDSTIKKFPFTKEEREVVIKTINQIINNYGLKSVKILFDDKFRGITLEKFKDNKIKKTDKGRESFEYPINGKRVKFIIADRDIVPLVGSNSLKNIFNGDKSLSLDGSYNIVSFLSTHLYRFIKIDDDIFNLNDVEKSYIKFFQDTKEIESGDNVGTKDIMFKKYILNNLKTYNESKDIVALFDMLETINFDFVYYDSLSLLSGKHYVRKL